MMFEEVVKVAKRVAGQVAVGTILGITGLSATIANAQNTPAATQGLTDDQCKIFKGHFINFVKDVGRENLSDGFVNAMAEFAVKQKCAAPASIPVTGRDLDVFNAISGIMYRTQGVELKKMGIVPVARNPAP